MAADPTLRDNPGNLLEAMIAAADQPGSGIDDGQVAGNVLTMLLAGEDTTANTLAWMIHLLWRHPAVLARAVAEVRHVTDISTDHSAGVSADVSADVSTVASADANAAWQDRIFSQGVRMGLDRILGQMVARGGLGAGQDPSRLADACLSLLVPSAWRYLVVERGWTAAAFTSSRHALVDALAGERLARQGAPPTPEAVIGQRQQLAVMARLA